MPRSLQEAIEEAEELADWFEAEGPSPDNWRPANEYYLECITEVREAARSEIAELVVSARKAGASWLQIGEALGASAAEAKLRFGSAVELAPAAQEQKEARVAQPEMPPLGR